MDEYTKWQQNYKLNFATKSKNSKVLDVYDYILKHEYSDGDFWHHEGNAQLAMKLCKFEEADFIDLKNDVNNWNYEQFEMLINSLTEITKWKDQPSLPTFSYFFTSLFAVIKDEFKPLILENSYFLWMGDAKPIEMLLPIRKYFFDKAIKSYSKEEVESNPFFKDIDKALEVANRN